MATAMAGCGDNNCVDDTCDLGLVAIHDAAAVDTIESAYDTSASVDLLYTGDSTISGDGVIYDFGSADDQIPVEDVPFTDDTRVVEVTMDGYDGEWYVYQEGTANVEVYAEYVQFSWSHTCSGVGDTIPSVLVQISHVPVADLQDWIDAIADGVKLVRLSDDSEVDVAVTPVEVPICHDGGCRSPAMAVYELDFSTDAALADEWYRIAMDPVPELVAAAVTANTALRFKPGHDARVGMIRYQAQAGQDNHGSFLIVFTEMMHSPALADFPTLRVAQGSSTDLECDFYTDDTMWLAPGEPQFTVRSCTGLDITQPFSIFLGGTLMTEDGTKLQPDGGEYQVDVPVAWDAACVDIWSCNEIEIP